LEVNAELFDENRIFLAKATGNENLRWLTEKEYPWITPITNIILGKRANYERKDIFHYKSWLVWFIRID